MTGHFDYFYLNQPTDTLEIEDVGNCAIIANNDFGEEFYLLIKTDFGFTRILTFGPYQIGIPPLSCSSTFNLFEYDERKISKTISKFLNNVGSKITLARVVSENEAKVNISNLLEFYEL